MRTTESQSQGIGKGVSHCPCCLRQTSDPTSGLQNPPQKHILKTSEEPWKGSVDRGKASVLGLQNLLI